MFDFKNHPPCSLSDATTLDTVWYYVTIWKWTSRPPEEREQAFYIVFSNFLKCTRNNL